ncbi:hypothetical protein CHARACLAT_011285 [Characodon lateralis]|uniref:Uncharacterized protein n=1 Tax=Characodon lateralis TaxID=208331 RepID=A0ABU7F4D1_9TELE|nr:hypothetical protein [Characodon lateralis]
MFLLGCHNRLSKQKQVVDISLATMLEAFLSEHRRTKTKCAGLISMHDYALHVQSSSGDVINLFQQETDARISHTDTHTHTHTHTSAVRETKPTSRCHGNKAPNALPGTL